MIGLLYMLVIVLANTIGAISGMGGGVIIKPLLDTIGYHSVAEISFYSTVAVFTMSIVSTIRQIRAGTRFKVQLVVSVAVGAMIGGSLGHVSLQSLLRHFSDDAHVQLVQIVITLGTLCFAYYYGRANRKSFQLDTLVWYVLCGLILGYISSLLGIGGGPINVALLILMFSMTMKEATVYSISIIFFSQLSKLVTIYQSGVYIGYDLTMLYYIIPAAVTGGLMGAQLNRMMPEQRVQQFFRWVIIVVMLINLYNAWGILK